MQMQTYQIHLTKWQVKKLNAFGNKHKIKRSMAVRKAVDKLCDKYGISFTSEKRE